MNSRKLVLGLFAKWPRAGHVKTRLAAVLGSGALGHVAAANAADENSSADQIQEITVTAPARMTVTLNGVLVQDNVALIGATVHGKVGVYAPHAAELPLALQDHGNPDSHVSFRNIWVKRL